MQVIPNVMGLVTYAPRLDEQKNSVKGIDFVRRLSSTFRVHCFDCDTSHNLRSFTMHKGRPIEGMVSDVINAASHGDLRSIKNFYQLGGAELLNMGDYDGRTAMHLACAEGQAAIV